MTWLPLFILWLGIFSAPKLIAIAIGVIFAVYLGGVLSIIAPSLMTALYIPIACRPRNVDGWEQPGHIA